MPSTQAEPLLERWSDAARAAALASRRRHMKAKGGYKASHVHAMTWPQFEQHFRAAHHSGDHKTTGMMARVAAQYDDAPASTKKLITSAAAAPPAPPPQALPHIGSPGRGPSGKVRNFDAMSDDKLKGVIRDLINHGKDRDAMMAAFAAGKRRGWKPGDASRTVAPRKGGLTGRKKITSHRAQRRRAGRGGSDLASFAEAWAERLLAEAASILATSSTQSSDMVSSKRPLSRYFHSKPAKVTPKRTKPRVRTVKVRAAGSAWRPPAPGVIRGGPHAGGVFRHGGGYTGAAQRRVGRIQHILRGLHLKPGRTDGVYGNKTTAAVRRFQAKHHLQVDGIVGAQTLAALKHYGAGGRR